MSYIVAINRSLHKLTNDVVSYLIGSYSFFYNIIFIGLFTLVYAIYIELKVGNVVLRKNSNNDYKISLRGLLHYITNPLYDYTLWNWSLIYLNYYVLLWIAYSFKCLFEFYYLYH